VLGALGNATTQVVEHEWEHFSRAGWMWAGAACVRGALLAILVFALWLSIISYISLKVMKLEL